MDLEVIELGGNENYVNAVLRTCELYYNQYLKNKACYKKIIPMIMLQLVIYQLQVVVQIYHLMIMIRKIKMICLIRGVSGTGAHQMKQENYLKDRDLIQIALKFQEIYLMSYIQQKQQILNKVNKLC